MSSDSVCHLSNICLKIFSLGKIFSSCEETFSKEKEVSGFAREILLKFRCESLQTSKYEPFIGLGKLFFVAHNPCKTAFTISRAVTICSEGKVFTFTIVLFCLTFSNSFRIVSSILLTISLAYIFSSAMGSFVLSKEFLASPFDSRCGSPMAVLDWLPFRVFFPGPKLALFLAFTPLGPSCGFVPNLDK
uniref:Uncharacterized protein n=1 Tax=Rousettus aegyptiacus TaxID=9407 RepID=A0A7J8EK81_ROUAE|nr:hypothetical protein HJG63_012553 [Rousettus aegyptiacus]